MPTNRTFYIIVITQTLSLVGSRMTAVAIGIWLFATTGRTSPLLLVAFFNELPGMAFGSLAGVLVDRWDRRRVLILADAGQALGTVLLLVLLISGRFDVWHLYAIALLQGVFVTFQQPAKDATTTMLVPEDQRERANALHQVAFPLAGVFAPALAGLVYTVVDLEGVIVIDLATFLVAVTAVALVHIPQPKVTEIGEASRGSFWQEMRGGFRFLASRQRSVLLGLIVYMTFIYFLLNGPLELTIPYLLTVTGSEATTGGIMGLMSLGALAGASLMTVWKGTRPPSIHSRPSAK